QIIHRIVDVIIDRTIDHVTQSLIRQASGIVIILSGQFNIIVLIIGKDRIQVDAFITRLIGRFVAILLIVGTFVLIIQSVQIQIVVFQAQHGSRGLLTITIILVNRNRDSRRLLCTIVSHRVLKGISLADDRRILIGCVPSMTGISDFQLTVLTVNS